MSSTEQNQNKSTLKSLQKTNVEDGIGARLKAARESKGLTHSDLHRITGLSRMVISKYEAGLNKPGARELRMLCDALEVSPNQLIYGTEQPYKPADNLAEVLLGMGEDAVLPVAMLAPMLGGVLGKDDLRLLLNLVESILKAKNPEEYRMFMELIQIWKETPKGERENLGMLIQSDPQARQEFEGRLQKRLRAAILKK